MSYRFKENTSVLTCGLFSLRALGSSALTDSAPSPSFLVSSTSHLLAPAGSITISLVWLLPLFSPWWNWKRWFSCSCVRPLGRSWMLGHQLGCCRGFVETETPPPPHTQTRPIFLLFIFSLEWCHSLGEWLSLPRWLCVLCTLWAMLMPLCSTKQGQRASVSLTNKISDLWSELPGKIHMFYVTT